MAGLLQHFDAFRHGLLVRSEAGTELDGTEHGRAAIPQARLKQGLHVQEHPGNVAHGEAQHVPGDVPVAAIGTAGRAGLELVQILHPIGQAASGAADGQAGAEGGTGPPDRFRQDVQVHRLGEVGGHREVHSPHGRVHGRMGRHEDDGQIRSLRAHELDEGQILVAGHADIGDQHIEVLGLKVGLGLGGIPGGLHPETVHAEQFSHGVQVDFLIVRQQDPERGIDWKHHDIQSFGLVAGAHEYRPDAILAEQ